MITGATATTSLLLRAVDVEVSLRLAADARQPIEEALGPLIVGDSLSSARDAWAIEPEGDLWWLRLGLRAPHWARSPAGLVGPLVHELNQIAARQSRCVALHAGGVALNGIAVVMPGPMESGKTTLTTGLVQAGCEYLSDEAIGIDDVTAQAIPYPKPLSIDDGSHPFFPELEPAARPYMGQDDRSWHVPVNALRCGPSDGPRPARLVVLCRHEHGAPTRLESISRSEAVIDMAASTFRFRERPRHALDTLARVARGATCHRLVTGDLAPAVDAVLGLLEEAGT